MKLSTAMLAASILTFTLSSLILFGVSPEQELWTEAVFTGYFSSVLYIAICSIADANGH